VRQNYHLPITDHRSPTTDHRLPTTDYRSPITDHRLPGDLKGEVEITDKKAY